MSSLNCITFSSAIDNAIEACELVKYNPYIYLSMAYDGNKLLCRIENSCVKQSCSDMVTTKEDIKNHGMGRRNIEKALSNYDVIFDVTHGDGKYVLSIIFMGINELITS